MNFRASPVVRVPSLDRAAVSAVETFGAGNFLAANFRGIRTSGVARGSDGQDTPIVAPLPDAYHYDKLEFSFGAVLNAVTAATLGIFVLSTDPAGTAAPGTQRATLIGTSVLTAGVFPSVTVPQYDARYYVAVTALTGTAITNLYVSVSGKYEDWRK